MRYVAAVLAVLLLACPVGAWPTWTGETGLWTVQTAETNAKGQWKFGGIFQNYERVLLEDDPELDNENDIDLDWLVFPVSYGITDWLEVSASTGVHHLRDGGPKTPRIWRQGFWDGGEIEEYGVADLRINAKFRIFDWGRSGVSIAPFVNVPLADESRGLGTGEVDGGLVLAGSAQAGDVGFHANLGYRWNTPVDDGPIPVEYLDQWLWGLGFDYQTPIDWLIGIVEMTGERQRDPRLEDDPLDLTVGARIPLGDSGWAADGGIRYALGEDIASCPWGGMLGIVYRSPPPVKASGILGVPSKKRTGIPYYDPCEDKIKVKVK